MSGFGDFPETEDPQIDGLFGQTQPKAAQPEVEEKDPDSYLEEYAVALENEGLAFTNLDGSHDGPMWATEREKRHNIASWHISAYHNGTTLPLGNVHVNINFDEFIHEEAVLYSLDQGITKFLVQAQHPVNGIIRNLTRSVTLDPEKQWPVKQALEEYREAQDGFGDDDDEPIRGPWDASSPQGETLQVLGEILQGPFEVLLGTMSKMTMQQAAQIERMNSMMGNMLDAHEKSMSKQLEAVNVASDVSLASLTRTANLLQNDEKHAANLAIAQRKLDLSVPFAEKLLMLQMEKDGEVDPMLLHQVVSGGRMEFMDILMAGISKAVSTGPSPKSVDLGKLDSKTSSSPATSSSSTPAQITQQPASPPAAPEKQPALAARLLKDATNRGSVLDALETANCTVEDINTLMLSKRQKAKLMGMLEEPQEDATE